MAATSQPCPKDYCIIKRKIFDVYLFRFFFLPFGTYSVSFWSFSFAGKCRVFTLFNEILCIELFKHIWIILGHCFAAFLSIVKIATSLCPVSNNNPVAKSPGLNVLWALLFFFKSVQVWGLSSNTHKVACWWSINVKLQISMRLALSQFCQIDNLIYDGMLLRF